MSRASITRFSNDSGVDPNIKKGDGQFTFLNGDTYVGGYMIVKDKRFISRQGRGIYLTEDFNKYETDWVEDQICGEVQICYNNGTQYKGTLSSDGKMFGFGIYTFIDNSVLEATWEQNKPVANIVLKESLGSAWKGVLYDGKEMAFTTGNHFWDEISPPIYDGEKEEDEKHSDIDSNDFEP